ncbi:MAG: hypothetical protein V8T87_03665 [Victivallales bacterium]
MTTAVWEETPWRKPDKKIGVDADWFLHTLAGAAASVMEEDLRTVCLRFDGKPCDGT